MKKNTLHTTAFAAFAMSALLLTGCGAAPTNTVSSIDDLKGKKIGVQVGTTGSTLAKDIEGAAIEYYNMPGESIHALELGEIDAVIADLNIAQSFTNTNSAIEILAEEFAVEEYALAVKSDNTALQAELNEALEALTQDGTLQRIKENYEGENKGKNPYVVLQSLSRSKGKLVLATNANCPPYAEHQGNEIVGSDIDMMNAICDYLDYELLISDVVSDSVISTVQNGTASVGIVRSPVTPELEKEVLFSNAYAVSHQVVIVRK